MTAEQLAHEQETRARLVPVAVVSGLLLVVAAITGIVGTHANVDEETLALIVVHKRFPLDLIGAIVNAGGLIALGVVLNFLFGATRARKPDLSVAYRYLVLVGAAVAGVAAVIYEVLISVAAHKFVTTGQQLYSEAHHLTGTGPIIILPTLAFAGDLLLAVALVMTSLNAMRVGLLPKAMGYLGIFVGILFLFPIGSPVPVIQAGWLCALAYLFLGRWPNAFPPAWAEGVAVPWPTSQRARATPNPPPRGARSKPRPAPEPVAAPAPAAGTTRSTTPKRKRKRRR